MQIRLTEEKKKALKVQHKTERDSRVSDRIKAVVLSAEGWTQVDIAQALLISPETIHDHLEDYTQSISRSLETRAKDEPILFGDGVHPTMATKITYGWIKKGTDKPIATVASRTRMNIMGALNLDTMMVTCGSYETINSEAMDEYFGVLKTAYATAAKIHLILDRGPYNTSLQTQESAKKHDIVLHYLPAYSPNLNPIERVWKVMNEQVRNNRVFASAKEFRQVILMFFNTTWPKIANTLRDRTNDDFQTLKPVPSG